MTERVELWLGHGTPPEEAAEIQRAFKDFGIETETRIPDHPLEIGNGAHWVIEVWLYGVTIGAFLTGLFGSAGRDAWKALKRLLARLNDSQPPAQVPWGSLVLKHPESGAQIIIGSDLLDKAYRQLIEIDFKPNTLYPGWNAFPLARRGPSATKARARRRCGDDRSSDGRATGRRPAQRTLASQRQERRVREVLGEAGLNYVEPQEIRQRLRALGDRPSDGLTHQEALRRGEYTREIAVTGTKCDVPCRLRSGELLPIECKVSNSQVNSVKRLNRETGGKHERWRSAFGTTLHTGAVLAGVFKLRNLQQGQVDGMLIFFDHHLAALARLVRAQSPRPKAR